MIIKHNKNEARKNRHMRIRTRLSGTKQRPRLSVFRSSCHIYAQIIDDETGKTLISCSTVAKGLSFNGLNKTAAAQKVGQEVAARAKNAGIKSVVFDRSGYIYTGRIRALAEGAREGGLEF